MNDNYDHCDKNVIYVIENILGPEETGKEFQELKDNFNSQIAAYCTCEKTCQDSVCVCLRNSGGSNYVTIKDNTDTKLILNFEAKDFTFSPVMECNSLCHCSENCMNRLVQAGPLPGLILKPCEAKAKGLGLYTAKFITKGTFICEYAGEIITKNQALLRQTKNKLEGKMNYIYCLNEHCNGKVVQTFIDPSSFGNIGRYINHSCEPNCSVIPVRVDSPLPKLAIFSCVDILPNTEITFDYGANNFDNVSMLQPDRKKCECNAKSCRGWMPFDSYG